MTENDEKVAEEYASTICGGIDGYYSKCKYCQNAKAAYLAGLAHERSRAQKFVEVLKIIATPLSDSINSSEVEIEQTLAAQRALKEYEGEAK